LGRNAFNAYVLVPIRVEEEGNPMHTMTQSSMLLTVMLCMIFVITGCSSNDTPQGGRYRNDEMCFSIEFHQGWEVIEGDGYEYALVEAVSPWEDEDDEFAEHISVDAEDLSRATDLATYHAEILEEQARAIPGFHIEEKGRTTIDAVPAEYVVFSFESEGYPMTAIGYTMISGGRGYLIAGLAQAHKFILYRDVFEKTAASFRIE
jgi:hypothetical protein